MTESNFVEPKEGEPGFTCPHCGTYSQHKWSAQTVFNNMAPFGGQEQDDAIRRSQCTRCMGVMLWYRGARAWPEAITVPDPNADLNDEIRADYNEAATILSRSPRGAAALLRLSLQMLCSQLGETGENINADIASLVQKGLPVQIQQALDVLRVVGNNAVHPGQIDLKDDQSTARALFDLINLIADNRLSEPKRIAVLYAGLPETARIAIERRDSAGPAGSA